MYLCQITDTILDVRFFCPFTSWFGMNSRGCCERANLLKKPRKIKKKKKRKEKNKGQNAKDNMVKQLR